MAKKYSKVKNMLDAGHFVVCSEMGPPIGADPDFIREKANYLKGYVDGVNVTDNQTAIVRMSSIAAAKIAMEEGLEMIIQITGRDRNRIGLQSDILGASALGLRNVLLLTGDHQTFGKDPGAKNVFEMGSVQLIKAVNDMVEDGILINGDEMKVPPKMFIGAAANPFADPFEMQMIKMQKKVKSGVEFFQTQAIYNMEKFEYWMEEVRKRGMHEEVDILAGILPTRSAKALRMMKKYVAGMDVPDHVIKRMDQAEDKEKEGVKMAVETIEKVREIEGVRGVHLMPVAWEEITPEVVKEASLYPRPEVE
ncbi:MAG: methylenetetrahydrofolate reductase [Halanaerobiales bacterium]|nr:methylenetetrahydrofolate reductase [Halanaerobiales bacterium]